jgi:uncharacterized membrane protein
MQGPGNNPQQPFEPAYNAPIPPPTGGPMMSPSGPAQIRFDVIGEAWKMFQANSGAWVAAMVVYFVIIIAVSAFFGVVMGGSASPMPGRAPSEAMPNIPMMIISQILQTALFTLLMGGMFRMAIKQVRGETPSVGDLFGVGDVLLNLIVASLLTTLAYFLGILLCVIPGLLAIGGLMFTFPLVVDKRLGAIEAMTQSWAALKGQYFMAFLFMFVLGIVASVGALLCGIGIVITYPLYPLAIAILYRDFFLGNEQYAVFDQSTGPSAPIPPVGF